MTNKTLCGIPVTSWVFGAIAKASATKDDSMTYWRHAWEETYFELGGKSASVAQKGCPMKAAYGLWQSGRIDGEHTSTVASIRLCKF